MRFARYCLFGGTVAALGVAAMPAPVAWLGAPKARYWMDAATTTGFGPGMSPMKMLLGRGGGGEDQHSLTLRLGSTLAANGGAPHADHFLPAGMNMGPSVPLETPREVRSTPGDATQSDAPDNFRQPRSRLLLFWGCGPHAGPGQPVVIDFSRMAQGQMPPHLFSTDVPREIGPMEANSRTYGHWPNSLRAKPLARNASLIGQHRVAGNYSPDISFALAQDFMPGLHVQTAALADGSTDLNWNAVMGATGYYATMMGARTMGGDNSDLVMWTSASRQEFGGGFGDYLAPSTVGRLVGQRLVMPPSQTRCTVPAEVKQAAGQLMMIQMTAYGPYVEVAYPPRPANPRTPWNPDWTVRVRFRSSTTVLPGIGRMGQGGAASDDGGQQQGKKACKPGIGGLLHLRPGC